jgi:hypothetical protein
MVFSSSLQHPNPFIQCMGLINFKSMFTVGDVVLLGDLFFNSYAQLGSPLCILRKLSNNDVDFFVE